MVLVFGKLSYMFWQICAKSNNINGVGLKSLHQMFTIYCTQVTSIDGRKLILANTQVYLSLLPLNPTLG